MNSRVFITGDTGFLGTQIVRRLIKKENCCIVVLVRGSDDESAKRHLARSWWEWPELLELINEEDEDLKATDSMLDEIPDIFDPDADKVQKKLSNRKFQFVRGDISKEKLGLERGLYEDLVGKVTHIIHTAADLRLNAPMEELRKINVQGTLNVLKLGEDAQLNHGIQRFSHVSTAYVAGGRKGHVDENSLTDEYEFLSNYERSKFEGEVEVKKFDLPVSVFRPGMVVGDSDTGYVKTFNTVYTILRLYLNGKMRIIPVSSSLKINLVPVDYVADAVTDLTFDPTAEGQNFHLTAPHEFLPSVRELVDFINTWAQDDLDLKLPNPIFLPLSSMIPYVSKLQNLTGSKGGMINTIALLSPYFNEKREFSRKNIEKLSGPYKIHWKSFLPKILDYAVYMGFFHRSDRTVHEQILFRLNSQSRPVDYYDVVGSRFKKRSSTEVQSDMLAAVRSLRSMGVGPGDRVAMVGFNSTRYLTLDVALGLVGAVNVPLYYTSPIDEIKEILKDCGASVLFVGTPQILDKLGEFEELGTKTISFCRESMELPSRVMSWKEFLDLGKSESEIKEFGVPVAPVDFNSIATIRYTSGTTGKPSGVTFTYGNLRWMAEFIASMPPWIDRNREVSYLSFLPMNHVVEGILGTYAPYYAPAPLKLYFLEDFQDLQRTLPKVRPTIFFSVPRFYEKVWSHIMQSKLGHMYLDADKGFKKRVLQRILKRAVLKNAGLDACAQLIVGSAPLSEDILRCYKGLGIEVHNAYGLTEAPLVTINRLGANRIGTVGEPLPCTDVKIKSDGEVMVRGPQVTKGYFNDKSRNNHLFKDGWLLTGDYGYLTPEGSLVITGRKKELIVNAYGKSISPLKIESMLKDIGCVSEAMVFGDEKPYCISLIWVDEDVKLDEIDEAMTKVNSKLSHPEKIKRWAVLKNDLSIENSDLTANLKLKRKNIVKRYQNLIKFMYTDWNVDKYSGEYVSGEYLKERSNEKIPENILKSGTLHLGSAGNNYEH
ncbi:AMP-binding protein [Methanobacterium aggregans]|uniref:AMP-binding protein n=1 Tax=Methanobacterium aggregans TaxID=1615586 RepID=UPI0032116124